MATTNPDRTSIRAGLTLALTMSIGLMPRVAQAQQEDAFYAQVEGGAAFMLSSPQSDRYNAGGYVLGHVGLRLVGPVGFHIMAGYWNWTPKEIQVTPNVTLSNGTLTVFGAGLSLAPRLSPTLGRLAFELDAGLGATGADGAMRFTFTAGLGWLFPLARPLAIGPFVRYGQMVTVDGDGNDPRFLTAGLAVAFPGTPPPPVPPPPDTDGDGLLDADDRCPTVPAGPHPDRARRGCPVGDRDNDLVLDDTDGCPDVPAGPHPDAGHPGCPGIWNPPPPPAPDCPAPQTVVVQAPVAPPPPPPPPPPAAPAAVIENGHININDSVYFDTGRATIQSRSFGVLDAVVTVLNAHPEIRRIRIDGHTDNVGNARRNLRLSRDRARAVQRYFTDHGVARERLSSEGYGDTRPAMPGDTEEARARNRRVEFLITEGSGAAASSAGAPADEEHGHHHRRHH